VLYRIAELKEPQTVEPPTPPPPYTEKHITVNQLVVFLSLDIRELRFLTQVPSKQRFCSNMIYPRGRLHNA
jgi:hypothetical protein